MTRIVRKPWGREYLAYSNKEVAVWVLEVKQGQATSLHAHAHKNTAIIVLSGQIELSFINSTKWFAGLDKINIFRGRFHRSHALSPNVVLLEVEAPNNKEDLVRLEDDYGRVKDDIEQGVEPITPSCLQIYDLPDHVYGFAGCKLQFIKNPTAERLRQHYGKDTVFVTLHGGLERDLVPAGDAIDGESLDRMSRMFPPLPNSIFLRIDKV